MCATRPKAESDFLNQDMVTNMVKIDNASAGGAAYRRHTAYARSNVASLGAPRREASIRAPDRPLSPLIRGERTDSPTPRERLVAIRSDSYRMIWARRHPAPYAVRYLSGFDATERPWQHQGASRTAAA